MSYLNGVLNCENCGRFASARGCTHCDKERPLRMHDEALRPHEGTRHTGRVGEDQAVTDKDATMPDDEIAFRTAINVLRDTLESHRMPSGLPLAPDAAALHDRAARHLEMLLRRAAGAARPRPVGGEDQA
jgi:hypothetical protein